MDEQMTKLIVDTSHSIDDGEGKTTKEADGATERTERTEEIEDDVDFVSTKDEASTDVVEDWGSDDEEIVFFGEIPRFSAEKKMKESMEDRLEEDPEIREEDETTIQETLLMPEKDETRADFDAIQKILEKAVKIKQEFATPDYDVVEKPKKKEENGRSKITVTSCASNSYDAQRRRDDSEAMKHLPQSAAVTKMLSFFNAKLMELDQPTGFRELLKDFRERHPVLFEALKSLGDCVVTDALKKEFWVNGEGAIMVVSLKEWAKKKGEIGEEEEEIETRKDKEERRRKDKEERRRKEEPEELSKKPSGYIDIGPPRFPKVIPGATLPKPRLLLHPVRANHPHDHHHQNNPAESRRVSRAESAVNKDSGSGEPSNELPRCIDPFLGPVRFPKVTPGAPLRPPVLPKRRPLLHSVLADHEDEHHYQPVHSLLPPPMEPPPPLQSLSPPGHLLEGFIQRTLQCLHLNHGTASLATLNSIHLDCFGISFQQDFFEKMGHRKFREIFFASRGQIEVQIFARKKPDKIFFTIKYLLQPLQPLPPHVALPLEPVYPPIHLRSPSPVFLEDPRVHELANNIGTILSRCGYELAEPEMSLIYTRNYERPFEADFYPIIPPEYALSALAMVTNGQILTRFGQNGYLRFRLHTHPLRLFHHEQHQLAKRPRLDSTGAWSSPSVIVIDDSD